MPQDDAATLLDLLEQALLAQDQSLREGDVDSLAARLKEAGEYIGRLTPIIRGESSLSPSDRARALRLAARAEDLERQGEFLLTLLQQDLTETMGVRRSLGSYRTAAQWPREEAAFLNRKG